MVPTNDNSGFFVAPVLGLCPVRVYEESTMPHLKFVGRMVRCIERSFVVSPEGDVDDSALAIPPESFFIFFGYLEHHSLIKMLLVSAPRNACTEIYLSRAASDDGHFLKTRTC